MAEEKTTTTTATEKTTEKPKEEDKSVARKINAWGFIVLLGLVFLVFGPVAAYLSWRSNTMEGANIAVKIIFAILAYIGNFVYIIWFAIMKTIVPKVANDVSESSLSPFSASRIPEPSPVPVAPIPAPAQPAPRPLDVDDDMDMMFPKQNNVTPIANPNQQGGKKKTKLHRRK